MADRVTEYAQHVASTGRYPDTGQLCGELHILACKRHLKDLENQNTEAFPYYWDVGASERIINFAEALTIAEGDSPKPLKLMGCQAFDLGCTFGWKKTSNNARRFRRRYKSIARQNGKSLENGIMGVYIAAFSGYHHGKLYTAATKIRQSRIVWEEMAKFIKSDEDLQELFEIKDYCHKIIAKGTECTIEALSQESGLEDGHRPLFASLDELHQQKNNGTYKALYNGTRSLLETLISMITTRGKQLNSFAYDMDKYARDVLRGVSTAEDFYVDIYCLNDGDDLFDEANWSKATPFTTCDPERLNTLRQDAQTARDMGGADLADFITKCLNMWVKNTDDQYIDPEAWLACGSDRTLEDVTSAGHLSCYVGLDLSSGGDLTTLSLEFPLPDGSFYLYSHSFMPRGRLEEHVETDLAPYATWEQQELITVTGGSTDYMNDYAFIVSFLQDLQQRFGLSFQGIGIDPHNAAGIMQGLESFGCPVVTITQSARNLNDATMAVQLLVKSGQIEYDRRNELLTWSMVNAAVVRNSFGEIKIDKKPGARFKRIDPADAIIDSHALMLLTNGGSSVDLNQGVEDYLKAMGWAE